MQPENKLIYFEYIIKGLINWYTELGEEESTNNFSVLKSLKLLFFVSAATSELEKKSILLEEVFDDFYAMPYGHVESSVYKQIRQRNGELNVYVISNSCVKVKQDADFSIFDNLDEDIKREIDRSLDYLKSQNKLLVKFPPFDLVNLSHAWYSWQKYYKMAQRAGVLSNQIPAEVIKSEDKLFKLNPF